jgi:hypothetical protein
MNENQSEEYYATGWGGSNAVVCVSAVSDKRLAFYEPLILRGNKKKSQHCNALSVRDNFVLVTATRKPNASEENAPDAYCDQLFYLLAKISGSAVIFFKRHFLYQHIIVAIVIIMAMYKVYSKIFFGLVVTTTS